MTRAERLAKKRAARCAYQARKMLRHHADCVACNYLQPHEAHAGYEFTRLYFADGVVHEYQSYARASRPIRIPRRFWKDLGRTVREHALGLAPSWRE